MMTRFLILLVACTVATVLLAPLPITALRTVARRGHASSVLSAAADVDVDVDVDVASQVGWIKKWDVRYSKLTPAEWKTLKEFYCYYLQEQKAKGLQPGQSPWVGLTDKETLQKIHFVELLKKANHLDRLKLAERMFTKCTNIHKTLSNGKPLYLVDKSALQWSLERVAAAKLNEENIAKEIDGWINEAIKKTETGRIALDVYGDFKVATWLLKYSNANKDEAAAMIEKTEKRLQDETINYYEKQKLKVRVMYEWKKIQLKLAQEAMEAAITLAEAAQQVEMYAPDWVPIVPGPGEPAWEPSVGERIASWVTARLPATFMQFYNTYISEPSSVRRLPDGVDPTRQWASAAAASSSSSSSSSNKAKKSPSSSSSSS